MENLSYDDDQVFTVDKYCSVVVAEYFQTAQENDCKVEILVDGEVKECVELYWEFAWDNRLVRMIFAEQKAGWHTIEIRQAGGNQNDQKLLKQFDIKLGIGCLVED